MVYRTFRLMAYIHPRQIHNRPKKKGKTMTPKMNMHVIWDFPVRVFNIVREKIAKIIADRAQADGRWLNG
ncbi:MAG: hypothetical protein JWM58_3473 [Rhizobium sp.]|nr:hypothetical protein [Rhizobium sp.]